MMMNVARAVTYETASSSPSARAIRNAPCPTWWGNAPTPGAAPRSSHGTRDDRGDGARSDREMVEWLARAIGSTIFTAQIRDERPLMPGKTTTPVPDV